MRAFWHVYAVNHWYDVAGEQLRALHQARFPVGIEAHVIGSGENAFELSDIAGRVGVRLKAWQHDENYAEYCTLKALHDACQNANDEEPVLYFHTKAVSKPGYVAYCKWRWMMNDQTLCQWPRRVADLSKYDAVGCCYFPKGVNRPANEGNWFAGNFWWARCGWIKGLPAPTPSADRLDCERWLLSAPGARIKSLIASDGEPYRNDFYAAHGQPHANFLRVKGTATEDV